MLTWRPLSLAFISAAVVFAAFVVGPVPQDPNYHLFADESSVGGVPNALNVLSNLPFLVVGLLGLRLIAISPDTVTPQTEWAWKIFFTAIALTAFGSGYFHWQPNNDTLIWDRLPMTIGFMSLVSIIVAEYFSPSLGKRLLWPLLLAGIGSVAYWAITESRGGGDLRPYAIVQFLPMLLIPMVIILYRNRSDLGRYVWWMIAFYAAAKIAEQLDEQLYALGSLMSGHTLKHLLASLAPASLLYGLMQRRKCGKGRTAA